MGKIFVPPHMSVSPGGEPYKVKGYWRRGPERRVDALRAKLMDAPEAPAAPEVSATPLADAVEVQDYRKVKGAPISIDKAKLQAIMKAVGIEQEPGLKIRLRFWDQSVPGEQGVTQRIGPSEYRVVVKVAAKEKFEDRHLYVMNNSLLHEMRHVTQNQKDPQMGQKYMMANMTVGYGKNPYEIDARYYGRLADHTGTKDTGKLGPAKGKKLWALT